LGNAATGALALEQVRSARTIRALWTLIRAILAVTLPVTLPTGWNARFIAGELIVPALGAAINLITSIWTVLFTIAVPGAGNAVPASAAELSGIAA